MKKNIEKKLSFPSKKVFLVVLVIFTSVILLSWLYYQSQRPNYRDLENAFNELNIPSDWQETNEMSVKGFIGTFCFSEGLDVECPSLSKTYKINDIKMGANELQKILTSRLSNYEILKNSCKTAKETCSLVIRNKNNTYTTIFFISENDQYKKIQILISDQNNYAAS